MPESRYEGIEKYLLKITYLSAEGPVSEWPKQV